MSNRPPKKSSSTLPEDQEAIRSKSAKFDKKVKNQGIAASGLTSRVKGHVSSRGKRVQAKRDGK